MLHSTAGVAFPLFWEALLCSCAFVGTGFVCVAGPTTAGQKDSLRVRWAMVGVATGKALRYSPYSIAGISLSCFPIAQLQSMAVIRTLKINGQSKKEMISMF